MHMSLRFDLKAMFFISKLNTNGEMKWFILAGFLVLFYGMFLGYLQGDTKRNKIKGIIFPLFEFLSMFVLMTYNFWIVLILFCGKNIGFLIFAIRKKRLLNENNLSKSQVLNF
jgi:hypothetical protein